MNTQGDTNETRSLPRQVSGAPGHHRPAQMGVIEAKGKKGAPTLVLVPGTLGMADIFWNQIVALKGKARVISLTVPPRSTSSSWPMVSRRSSTCSASTRRICWVRLSADS